MPTAYLHIGAHKTGTSAFQSFLKANRDWLGEHGILVPQAGQVASGAHHKLGRAITDASAPPNFRKIAAKFEAEAKGGDGRDLLISTEALAMRIQSKDALKQLVDYFESLGYSVAVIYYLRSMAPYFNSAYAQMAKTLNQPLLFEDALAGWLGNEEYFSTLPAFMSDNRIRKIVRPYTKAVRNAGIVPSILGEMGLPPPPVEQRSAVNTSPGPMTIYLGRWLTRKLDLENSQLTPRQKWACVDAVNQVVKANGSEPASYVGLTVQSARRIETTLENWCEDFAQAGWGRSWADTFAQEIGQDYQCNDIEVADTFRPSESLLAAMRDELLECWSKIKQDPEKARAGAPALSLAA